MTSLGFDTIIVDNHMYDNESLALLFDTFSSYDVRNFIFFLDFDFSVDSISLTSQKIKDFKARLTKLTPRGVHAKICYNLYLTHGAVYNKDIKRLYADKRYASLFISLPILTLDSYSILAQDINHLLYRSGIMPICSRFDTILEGSDKDISIKLLRNSNIAFGFEANYLLSAQKSWLITELINNQTLFIPTISDTPENCVEIVNNATTFKERIGKDKYYSMCSLIRKCSKLFGF